MKHRVFCSVPMTDVPWREIELNLFCMKQQFTAVAESKYGFSPDDEFLFMYYPEEQQENTIPIIWHLLRSLEKLVYCDMALFHSDWDKDKRCIIEHDVCTSYGIPVYYCFKEGDVLCF